MKVVERLSFISVYIRNLNICVIHTVDHVNLHRMFHRVQRLLVDVEHELLDAYGTNLSASMTGS